MPLISRTIPNLVQGISQQPEILRLNSQATSQVNGFSSVVEGLKKRPPTNYIAKLTGSSLANAYVHTINRDVNERYIVTVTNGAIAVYNIAGTAKTVVMQTNAANYLSSSDPKSDFVAVTVADYTYILNKTKTCAMAATTSTAKVEQAVYSVLQGVNSTKYAITIDGATFSFTSSNTDTEAIRNGVKTACGTIANITFADVGTSSFSIIKSTGTLTVTASDGYGDDASQVVGDKVQNFSDLPSPAINNMVVEITGDATNSFDNYYVKYDSSDDVWTETVSPATKTNLDSDLMPHVLIRTADGNFRFTQVDGSSYTISATSYDVPSWGTRVAGDLESSPDPSFIGKKMNDIFFHRNRLGFIADENVIMSRSGEFFHFFPETVTDTLSTDPIDVASTAKKVSILRSVISFDENLLLFSDQTQFMLTGGNTLTSENVSINTATEFETSTSAKPVGAGSNVFFAFNKGSYTGIREFYVEGDSDTKKAEDITANVPKYLPSNVFKLTSATNENILIALSSNSADQNTLYVYQYFIGEGKRLQSAWHKWSFGFSNTDKILNIDFIENTLYIVNERSDGVYLESLDISPAVVDASANYLTYLDRKIQDDTTGTSSSYNAGTNVTTFTIPYSITNTTCTISVTDFSNIATNSTIVLTTHAGAAVTFTCQGAGTGTPATNKFFHNQDNDTTADNIFTCINLHADFSAANPAANVVTVTRAAVGNDNLTVTSSDTTRLAVTDFVEGNILKCIGRVGGTNTAGQALTIASQSGTSLTISGNQTSKNLWFGEQYEFSFVFSQQFMQISDNSGSRISVKEGRLQIRNWNVSYNDTGYFTTEVLPVGRDASTTSFTGTTTGSGALGTVNLSDGDYTFAVQSENDKLTVTLKNDSHLPSNFINASWQGYYVTASSRE